jgi:phospholipid/cholesterol/gamma-HCH transport system permease protein
VPTAAVARTGDARVAIARRGDTLHVALSGRLDADSTGAAWRAVFAALGDARPAALRVDASAVDYCDGSGIGLLVALRGHQEARRGRFELVGLRDDFQRLLELLTPPADASAAPPAAKPIGHIEELGRSTMETLDELRRLVVFTGELTDALAWALTHPHRVRWRDVLLVAERAGVNALPIIGLIGFIMGLILAFQSAVQLQRFAAELFTADAVAISLVRELGALMTAVILAGRSGSAFAAEIGTMKVNEEVDALTTMGLDPVRFLVVTRVLAAVAVTPILSIFFILFGLVGGGLVMISIGFPAVAIGQRMIEAAGVTNFIGGLVKAFVFGILVAAIGCLRGLETRGGASAVGESATSAVVSGLVLIAAADGILAVVYYFLDV